MNHAPLELQAVVLGLVQGLCEFLPISSSAHLVVLPELLGWPYLGKAFDVALHAGTLLALVLFFRMELRELWKGLQRLIYTCGRAQDPQARLVKLLLVGSVPAALAGFFLDDLVEPYLQGLLPVALFSIFWGIVLGWADNSSTHSNSIKLLTSRDAFCIGCAQAAALLPGTSRSGATITAALFLGLSRPEAARFSLLLSIPVIAGATLFKGLELEIGNFEHDKLRLVLLGVTTSAIAGGICLKRFLSYLEQGSFRPFVVYRVSFGVALLSWLLTKC